jgi:pseudoazurin
MLKAKGVALMMAVGAAALAQPAHAKEWQVKMLNNGPSGMMVFEPALLTVAKGDTVRFVPADKGHNAETMAGMLPAGAKPFKGAINEAIAVPFIVPGLYGYKCLPHAGLGMVGLIQVGKATNKADIAAKANSAPGLAKKRFAELLTRVK